jgi:hypothetical protein
MENFALLPHRAEAHTTVLSKSVGQRFRACPDANGILAGLAARENGTKVLSVINRGSCDTHKRKEFPWQKNDRGYTPKDRGCLALREPWSPRMFPRARVLSQRPHLM